MNYHLGRVIITTCLFFGASANAQESLKDLKGTKPFEMKGYKIGDTIPDQETLKSLCSPYFARKIIKTGSGVCLSVGTFAGIENIGLVYQFKDYRIYNVMSDFPLSDYTTIKNALREKYGAPAKEFESVATNGFGAKFQQIRTVWGFSDGVLMISRISGKIDRSAFMFLNSEQLDALEQKPKVDF